MKELYLDKEKIYKEECRRHRNLRLIQTRQISKQIAAKVRNDYKAAKDNEIKKYKSAKRAEKNRIAEENLAQMEEAAQNEIEKIGEGHLSAANYDDKSEERRQRALENEQRAEERGRQALEAEREMRVSQENKENAHIVARQQALEQERERTSRVVKMPRARDELAQLFTDPSKPTKLVTVHDSNVFATTRYHMPEHIVERDDDQGMDAREAASAEQKRQSEAEKSAARARNEREEKARLRGKHALEKEVLAENYQEILGELNALQRADWERKQKELGNIPKGVFAPAWQREQDKNEFQMELERQFEKIYVDENLRKEEMPQPIDARLSEPSQTSNAGEEEDADLDLTLVDEANDINPERVENPAQVASTLINKPEEEEEKVAETTANVEGAAKLNQLLIKIRAQKKVMAEKRHREKLRKEQGIEIETDESSLCSTSRSDDMSSNSRSPSPRKDQEVDQSVGFTEDDDDDMTSMITATATGVAAIGADQLGARTTSSRRMGAIMMSSHNVSSVNEFFHLEERVRKEERRRKVARRSTNTVTTTRSVDLSHASRDPMLAGPRELLNHNEIKLNEEYKRRYLDQQAEELKRVLKQLEEQEAQLESEASSIVNSSHSNLMKSSSIVSSSSLNEAAATASSSSHHDHQQQHQTDEDEEQLKRIEFQKQLLSASGARREADEYEYVRLIEERKREMAARFGPFDLLLPSMAAAVVNKPMSQTGVSSVDSGVVLNRIGGSESTITNIDKRTAYSSADSGFGAASGSNRLNVVASNSAAGANYRPESTSRFSLLKTPINLAVEQLNSEIQGISKIGQEATETQQHSESSSESTTDKRRLSQISTSSSSSCSSYTSENHTHHQQTIGLERYDSTSWTTQTSLDGSSAINQHQHVKKDSSASTSVDGESINHTESERDSSDDDLNDVNLDTLLASLLNSRPQETSSSLERRFEEIRRLKEELELPPPPPPPPVQNRHLTAARLNLSTINEVDTPMSERNVKLVSKTVDTIKNNTTTNRSSFTQVSSINPVNTNNDTSEFEETILNSRNDENYPASQNASSLSSSATTIESTSTPINQQSQKSDADDTDAVKLTLSKFKQRQQILFNISLFNSSDSATTPTNLSEKSSSSRSSSSNRSNSKNNVTNRSGKSENPSNGSGGKKWFDILASDNDKSNSSSNSSVLITGPCSPEEPSKKQLFLNESSCSEPSLVIGKFEDEEEEEEVNEKSQARLIESITPSSILVDYSLVSLPTPVAQRNKDTAPAATTAALERTLEEIRVTLSPPQSSASRRHSSEIATKSITTANATTYKRTISQQSLRSQQNKSPIETSSNSGQTSSSQSSSQLTRTTTSKSSKSTGADESSSSPSSLFERFLKTHSTTNTASVLDEPEISFVSSVASNSTSPTKTRSMTQSVSQTSSNTMSTTTSSNTTSTTASASFLAFLEQQKRDLSAQFEHVSPIDTSISNVSRRRAHQISTTTPSIQNSRSSASASTRSSLSTLGNLRTNQAAANSLQTAQNDRFTTVSSLIAATNDTIQNEPDEKTMSADESSSNQFHDLPPFDFHDNKNNEKMKPKIKRPNRLARKLFDSYYVDFDGRYVGREVNQLQNSCLRHLSMIKTRQHCLNETCHCGLTSKERRIKLKLDSPVRKLEAKKKLIKDNRDKLKQFTSYVNERNRKMFDKTAKNKNYQCNKRR